MSHTMFLNKKNLALFKKKNWFPATAEHIIFPPTTALICASALTDFCSTVMATEAHG